MIDLLMTVILFTLLNILQFTAVNRDIRGMLITYSGTDIKFAKACYGLMSLLMIGYICHSIAPLLTIEIFNDQLQFWYCITALLIAPILVCHILSLLIEFTDESINIFQFAFRGLVALLTILAFSKTTIVIVILHIAMIMVSKSLNKKFNINPYWYLSDIVTWSALIMLIN